MKKVCFLVLSYKNDTDIIQVEDVVEFNSRNCFPNFSADQKEADDYAKELGQKRGKECWAFICSEAKAEREAKKPFPHLLEPITSYMGEPNKTKFGTVI